MVGLRQPTTSFALYGIQVVAEFDSYIAQLQTGFSSEVAQKDLIIFLEVPRHSNDSVVISSMMVIYYCWKALERFFNIELFIWCQGRARQSSFLHLFEKKRRKDSYML